jgi:glycosyltransferase involved in cell wall biosynthesis
VSGALVSVIVPFYNSERYVGEAIRSVLAQTYRPLELLLVDDGSTDDSADIARSLAVAHAELHLLRLPENQGPAAARNRGLADARGDFITFLDADDCMVRERLALQVRYLTERSGVGLVLCAEELVFEPDAPLTSIRRRQSRGPGPRYHMMSMMVRRRALELVGGFDPSYRVAEDLDWLFRASVAGIVVEKIDRVLTRHRLHGNNLSYRTAWKEIEAAMIRSLRSRLLERRRDESVTGVGHHPVL